MRDLRPRACVNRLTRAALTIAVTTSLVAGGLLTTAVSASAATLMTGGRLSLPVTSGAVRSGLSPVGGAYQAVTPSRILDTRTRLGGTTIPARGSLILVVAGHGGVPPQTGFVGQPGTGPSAANINFTATNAGAPGFLTVYPTGSGRPPTSNLNFVAGQNVANTSIAKLGSGGSITAYNGSAKPIDLVGDVSGYYLTGPISPIAPKVPGAYVPLTNQARLLDTRTLGTVGKLPFGHHLSVTVTNIAGVPATAGAVVLNVTSTNASVNGHLRVYPADTPPPFASNVNFTTDRTVANQVVVAPAPNGKVSIYNGAPRGNTDVVVDVIGYTAGGLVPARTAGLQTVITPFRLLDTRSAIGTAMVGRVRPGAVRVVKIAGVGRVPTTAEAAVMTVTATNETTTGFATVYSGSTRPYVSILNFLTRIDVANVMVAPISADGTITIFNGGAGPSDLIIDVSAFISGKSSVNG